MIRKKDLFLEKGMSYSHDDYPYLYRNGSSKFGGVSYAIFIGSFQIAGIVECNNGRFVLSHTYSDFKSFEGAMRGLLERLNKRKSNGIGCL